MEAGRELDALIAERVMGLKNVGWRDYPAFGRHLEHIPIEGPKTMMRVPQYSTDIAAAWEVVEKVVKQGKHINIAYYPNPRWSEMMVIANEKDSETAKKLENYLNTEIGEVFESHVLRLVREIEMMRALYGIEIDLRVKNGRTQSDGG